MTQSLEARSRRRRAAVLLGLAVAGTSLIGTGPADAASSPALTLEASRSSVTLYRESHGDGGLIYGDLGIYALAGKKAFEVRASRDSYSKPIVAKLKKSGKDPVLPTPADFTGLTDFSTTTFTDAAGEVIDSTTSTFCPNSGEPVRRRPTAPARSPYPQGCYGNPYSLGAVWGIQAGYAVSLSVDYYPDSGYLDLPVGEYTATTTINSAYRKTLGITRAQATATVKVTVEIDSPCDEEDGCLNGARTQARPGPATTSAPKKLQGKKVKPSGPLPDLRSLPAWDINVGDGRYLNFSATVWNAGPGPLVVDGFRRTNNPDLMDAYQYFFSSSGKQKGYAQVGGMEWDDRDGHEHWHFQDFASYNLLDAKKQFLVRSEKEAFCLANTDAVDYLVKGANWKPENTDLRTSCGERESLGVREVLDTGSGDTYGQDLPGQSFDLQNLENGTYYIQIVANPEKVLYEKKTSNNISYRKVVISGTEGARMVTAAKIGVVDELTFNYDPDAKVPKTPSPATSASPTR